jgi:hypothetical protein
MFKKCVYLTFFLMLVLGLTQDQARGAHLAAYWDDDYPTHWIAETDTVAVRDALEAAGYEILDAAQLKAWMDARIADGVASVIVFCKDVGPDTVCETNTAECTLRRYLDAGGKIVFYGDIPFYNQGNPGGVETNWGNAGATGILGFNAAGGTWDTSNTVAFTDEGIDWGLTETWASVRPANPDTVDIVLATDDAGNAAAWVKHFVPGDTTGGFVRIWDRGNVYSVEDLMRVAQYGLGGNPYPRGPNPADGALHEDTWVTLSWYAGDFAVSHDVYLGDNFDDVEAGAGDTFRGNQGEPFFVAGFPGFPYPDGLIPGTTYYWRIDEVNDADPNSPWSGPVWSFSIPPRTAYNPDPADGAELVDPNDPTLSWTPGFGAKLHTVYFGGDFDMVNTAIGGMPIGITTYNPGPLESAKVYYWRVDEFDALATHEGDVWSFTTPGAVGNPGPAYGATEVGMNATLSWTPADSAASHELYFGTDEAAVRGADTGAPEYKGSIALGAESHDPGLLDADTAYYWRVDEVDGQGNTAKGPLWIFTTGNFLLVDDFESYTDDDAAGEAIWQTWIDGFGVADNGAQVGYLMPPYAEQTIVHGGLQSMPLLYTNEAGVANSEGSMTLTAPRDWTLAGVAELSLWFRGGSSNATEPLYVSVANSGGAPSVVAHVDAGAAAIRSWTQWRIPLQALSDQGINLGNVDKIAIGLGSKGGAAAGGTGTMYIDDIRLYRP